MAGTGRSTLRFWWNRRTSNRPINCRNCGEPLIGEPHNGQFCSEACDRRYTADMAW